MFAPKNFAFLGHMDGWEYQDLIMALCSFMCDALCSVFPKTSNQAWGWTVPFRRIFNWKVKISTRPGDKSCCLSPHPPPPPPLCLSLSTYTYVRVFHPTHSSAIPFLRPRASKRPAAAEGLPQQHTVLQAESHAAICEFAYRGLVGQDLSLGSSWHSPADGSAAPHHRCVLCVSLHVGRAGFPFKVHLLGSGGPPREWKGKYAFQWSRSKSSKWCCGSRRLGLWYWSGLT